jgi:hypothetical protein
MRTAENGFLKTPDVPKINSDILERFAQGFETVFS